MPNVSIADARAQLSALIDQANSGETVTITRRGKPVARLMAVEATHKPIDVAALRALIAAHPAPDGADKDFDAVRYLRDDARY